MKNHTLNTLSWLRMMRFIRNSNHASQQFLQDVKLTPAQFDALAQVYHHAPLTQSELAQHLLLTEGSISRMLTRLEKDGYICRTQNWKTKTIALTNTGKMLIEKVLPQQTHFQSSLFEQALTKEEQKQLYKLLTKLHKSSEGY